MHPNDKADAVQIFLLVCMVYTAILFYRNEMDIQRTNKVQQILDKHEANIPLQKYISLKDSNTCERVGSQVSESNSYIFAQIGTLCFDIT